MNLLWKRRLRAFLPSAKALVAAWAAVGLLLIGGACAIAFALTAETGGALENVAFILGVITLPLVGTALALASLLEKNLFARGAFGCGALLAWFAAMVALTAGLYFSAQRSGWPTGLCLSPFVLLSSVPVILVLRQAPEEWRRISREAREELALNLIQAGGGQASYADLARELRTSEAEVDNLLAYLIKSDKLQGSRQPQRKLFITAAASRDKRARLLRMVGARGQVSLDELTRELGAPRELIQDWVYQMMESERFTGYINWKEGVLFSAEAAQLRQMGACPQCGSKLELGGKRMISCPSCGLDMFLPTDSPT
jgi:biotin operon repressor